MCTIRPEVNGIRWRHAAARSTVIDGVETLGREAEVLALGCAPRGGPPGPSLQLQTTCTRLVPVLPMGIPAGPAKPEARCWMRRWCFMLLPVTIRSCPRREGLVVSGRTAQQSELTDGSAASASTQSPEGAAGPAPPPSKSRFN